MRTRRSPRNQEALWKALGRQGAQPEPKPAPQPDRTHDEWMAWFLSHGHSVKRSRQFADMEIARQLKDHLRRIIRENREKRQ